MDINQKLERMIQEVHAGSSVDDAICKVLGGGAEVPVKELREKVRALISKAEQMEKQYAGADMQEAVFQEIEKQCGGSRGQQFSRLSSLKRLVNMRNLKLSESMMREQGSDVNFAYETIQKVYEEEQKMAEDASEEELSGLKDELASILPQEQEEIQLLLRQNIANGEPGEFGELGKVLDEIPDKITGQNKEDFSVVLAAVLMSEKPDISSDEAAMAAAIQTAQSTEDKSWYLWLAVPAALTGTIAGLILWNLSEITGISILSEAGFLLVMGSVSILGLISLLAAGAAVYEAVKLAVPAAEKAWKKCRPFAARAAEKVKKALSAVFGVVTDKVLRPVIYWTNNSAMPVIREKIAYPMKRRLNGLLAWIKEKKEQIVCFIKDAAVKKSDVESDIAYDIESDIEHDIEFDIKYDQADACEPQEAEEPETAFA